jgi:hypothetical protein
MSVGRLLFRPYCSVLSDELAMRCIERAGGLDNVAYFIIR